MKQFSIDKLKNMKDHLSQQKKIYGLAAMTLVFGTLFSESVLAVGDAAAAAEVEAGGWVEFYDESLSWFRKIGKLGLLGVILITCSAAAYSQKLIPTAVAFGISIVLVKGVAYAASMLGLAF